MMDYGLWPNGLSIIYSPTAIFIGAWGRVKLKQNLLDCTPGA
jgi:hypothetical protein